MAAADPHWARRLHRDPGAPAFPPEARPWAGASTLAQPQPLSVLSSPGPAARRRPAAVHSTALPLPPGPGPPLAVPLPVSRSRRDRLHVRLAAREHRGPGVPAHIPECHGLPWTLQMMTRVDSALIVLQAVRAPEGDALDVVDPVRCRVRCDSCQPRSRQAVLAVLRQPPFLSFVKSRSAEHTPALELSAALPLPATRRGRRPRRAQVPALADALSPRSVHTASPGLEAAASGQRRAASRGGDPERFLGCPRRLDPAPPGTLFPGDRGGRPSRYSA